MELLIFVPLVLETFFEATANDGVIYSKMSLFQANGGRCHIEGGTYCYNGLHMLRLIAFWLLLPHFHETRGAHIPERVVSAERKPYEVYLTLLAFFVELCLDKLDDLIHILILVEVHESKLGLALRRQMVENDHVVTFLDDEICQFGEITILTCARHAMQT